MSDEWDVSPKEAIDIQKSLRSSVVLRPLKKDIKTVAGVDVSMNLFGKDLYAGVIVLSFPELRVIEEVGVVDRINFPYIPGLLSFREVPALLKCIEKLSVKPDVLIVDGQGIAHPRRLGIAAHLGVITRIPSIGCAKSPLYGSFDIPSGVGDTSHIIDPKTGEVLGVVLKSKLRSNPLFISPGYLADVDTSLELVRRTLRGYRLPEPTRRAHLLVYALRKDNS